MDVSAHTSDAATKPAAPFDMAAARALWQEYAAAHPDVVAEHPEWEVDRFADTADYATEMRAEKHPYSKGVAAREGVEF